MKTSTDAKHRGEKRAAHFTNEITQARSFLVLESRTISPTTTKSTKLVSYLWLYVWNNTSQLTWRLENGRYLRFRGPPSELCAGKRRSGPPLIRRKTSASATGRLSLSVQAHGKMRFRVFLKTDGQTKKNTPSTFKKIQVQRVEEKDGHEEKICNMLSGGVAHRDTTTPGHRDISPWGPRICSVWAPVICWQKAFTEVLGWVQN